MYKTHRSLIASIIAGTVFSASAANAALIVTYAEAPDDVNSRLSGTTVFNFNDFTPGQTYTNVTWEGVGTLDRIRVLDADQYGGAVDPGFEDGSPYSVQNDGMSSTTITLFTPHAYFGFWWSAGDAQNILEFYDGDHLVGRFTTATLLDRLSETDDYHGNPRHRNLNPGENYAFINFFGQDGSTWNKIVLSNGPGSGFESDNYTDREQAWSFEEDGPMPGHQLAVVDGQEVIAVPETGSATLGAVGIFLLLTRRAMPRRAHK